MNFFDEQDLETVARAAAQEVAAAILKVNQTSGRVMVIWPQTITVQNGERSEVFDFASLMQGNDSPPISQPNPNWKEPDDGECVGTGFKDGKWFQNIWDDKSKTIKAQEVPMPADAEEE